MQRSVVRLGMGAYLITRLLFSGFFSLRQFLGSATYEVMQAIGGLDYTIVRPGGLKNEPGTGKGILTDNPNVCGAIHREDVADCVVKALFSSKADGKVSALKYTQLQISKWVITDIHEQCSLWPATLLAGSASFACAFSCMNRCFAQFDHLHATRTIHKVPAAG